MSIVTVTVVVLVLGTNTLELVTEFMTGANAVLAINPFWDKTVFPVVAFTPSAYTR